MYKITKIPEGEVPKEIIRRKRYTTVKHVTKWGISPPLITLPETLPSHRVLIQGQSRSPLPATLPIRPFPPPKTKSSYMYKTVSYRPHRGPVHLDEARSPQKLILVYHLVSLSPRTSKNARGGGAGMVLLTFRVRKSQRRLPPLLARRLLLLLETARRRGHVFDVHLHAALER